jgi:membrane protein required for colicin V production
LPFAKSYFNNDIVATAGGRRHFLGTLLIVSVITVRFSDMVLVGALTARWAFVWARARLIIVVVAFLFALRRPQPAREWIRAVAGGAAGNRRLADVDVDDPESTILKRLKKPKPDEELSADDPLPMGQRSSLEAPTRR